MVPNNDARPAAARGRGDDALGNSAEIATEIAGDEGAMHFRSSTSRNYYLATLFSFIIDVSVCYAIAEYVESDFPTWLIALVLPIAVYLCSGIYSLYLIAKRVLWYKLFERNRRIDLLVSEMHALHFPTPENQYDSAQEYLERVGLSESVPAKSRLVAGQMLGIMNSNTLTERFIATLVLEAAIGKFQLQALQAPKRA